jgi:ABC-type multidrug transport system fused ATPase/permease subunit
MEAEQMQRSRGRARQYARFIRTVLALHPKLFATSVAGASLFAVCTVASSVAIRWVIDNVIVPRFEDGDVATSTVVGGCVLVIVIGVLRAIGVVVRRGFGFMNNWRVAESLTNDVTDRYVTQPASWHQRQTDGLLLARAGVDIDTSISVLAPIPFATSTVLMLIISAVWLISLDLLMGLVAVAVFPLLLGVNLIYERSVNHHFDAAQAALGDFSGAVHESFEAVQLVKAYGAEQRETERLSVMAGRIRDSRVRAVHLRGTFEAMLELIPSITNIGLVVLGAWRVDSGHITIGQLSGFIYLFTLLVFPMRLIGYALSELPPSYAGYRRVRGVIDDPLEPDPETTLGVTVPPVAVALDGAGFTYAGETQPAIHDTSMSVGVGSVTAFVGATGSGKSTLVELIGGLLQPTTGSVALTAGARALVFQEGFLFSGTVRENIVVSDEFGDDEVWEALRMASADAFVTELPGGLDTVVGERGVTLSGGQRQRIALARALVRRPSLLLLDDTTSALDPATELAVLGNLRAAMSDTTVIMVASRPSTISLADDVIFIADGRIAAQGEHARLMADEPRYRQLVEAFESDRDDADAAQVGR